MINVQSLFEKWINEEYSTQEEKENTESLNINGMVKIEDEKELDNSNFELVIRDFPQLKQLYCSENELTSLTIINCPKICHISCQRNNLTNLDFLKNINLENLIFLDFRRNKIEGNLSTLQKFVNLEQLFMESNSITGSLKFLRGCKNLREIYFKNTDIDSGVEYLPKNLEQINFNDKIISILRSYGISSPHNNKYLNHPDTWKNIREILMMKGLDERDELLVEVEELKLGVEVAISALGPAERWGTNKKVIEELKTKKLTLEKSFAEMKNSLKNDLSEESKTSLEAMLNYQDQIAKLTENYLSQQELENLRNFLESEIRKESLEDALKFSRLIVHMEEVIKFLETSQKTENLSQIQVSPK